MRIKPNIDDKRLTRKIFGFNELLKRTKLDVIEEKPLSLFLNDQEIVTMMTINDHPKFLALGYLLNQNMINSRTKIEKVEYYEDLMTVVVRTKKPVDYQKKLRKKTLTSGCAQGTLFGDIMESFKKIKFRDIPKLKMAWIYELSKKINLMPSLYLKAGAIHGCVLCEKNKPLVYMEDVGRHNAIDKIAGFMFVKKVKPGNKIFYTTGRLTSEMVIKAVKMKIPIVISRSGFTAWGVELARKANLTLIGRAKGKRFIILSGEKDFMNFKDQIFGIVLCGGLSRRMGSDKSQKKIGNLKLIDIVIEKAISQVGRLALNAENLKSEKFNLELVPDCQVGNLGPLIGILSGLLWTKKNNFEWLMVFPVDSPFFPNNIVESFVDGLKDQKIIMAKSNNKLHPVFSMWNVDLISELEFAIENDQRKIDVLTKKKTYQTSKF